MYKVVVHINSRLHHFSQLLAGFEFLSSTEKISLDYHLEIGRYPGDIFRVEIDEYNVFFDLADNSNIRQEIYEESDFYVKRMLLKSDKEKYFKAVPYGLYYPVYYKSPRLKFLFLKDRSLWKYSLKYWKSVSAFLNLKDGIAVNELSQVESFPADEDQVIFRARLWDPGNNPTQWKKEERIVLNDQRIILNRALKERFPLKFTGGILKNEYSENLCPDLVLPHAEYHRKRYFQILKGTSVGVVNQGLERSIGAKLGEYVANSLAILTTPIDEFELPGFQEEKNYFTYRNTKECVDKVQELVENPSLRSEMQFNNRKYYSRFLHPGKKISTILDEIEKKSRHKYIQS